MQLHHHIEALKKKDRSAFEAIYHETRHAVYAMALGVVKDRFLAEDIMQVTYMKMVENIHAYDKGKKFINWLLTIAKNEALDTLRRRRQETAVDGSANEDLFLGRDMEEEKRIEIEELMKLLSETEKTIVLLKTVADLRHKDIAEILGMPLGTVIWKYNKALKAMRREGRREET